MPIETKFRIVCEQMFKNQKSANTYEQLLTYTRQDRQKQKIAFLSWFQNNFLYLGYSKYLIICEQLFKIQKIALKWILSIRTFYEELLTYTRYDLLTIFLLNVLFSEIIFGKL